MLTPRLLVLSDLAEADNELVRRFLRLPGFSALGQPGALPVGRLATRMGATLAAAAAEVARRVRRIVLSLRQQPFPEEKI